MLWVQLFPVKVRNIFKLLSDFSAGPTSKPANFLSHSVSQAPLSSLPCHCSSNGWILSLEVHEHRTWPENCHKGCHGPFPHREKQASTYLNKPSLQQMFGGLPQAIPKGKTTTGGTGGGQRSWSTINHMPELLLYQFNEYTLARSR